MNALGRTQALLRQTNDSKREEEPRSTAQFKLPGGLARHYGLDQQPAPVSQPGDPAEARADAVADRVTAALGGGGGGGGSVESVRARMQPHVDSDLSRVQFHTGGESTQAARALNARAFTIGNDIHFGEGQFQPGTREGDRLIAHEIGHTGDGVVGRQVYRMKLHVRALDFEIQEAEDWKAVNKELFRLKDDVANLPELIEISKTLQRAKKDGDYFEETLEGLDKAMKNVGTYIVGLGGEVPDIDAKEDLTIKPTATAPSKGKMTKVKKVSGPSGPPKKTHATSTEIFGRLSTELGACTVPVGANAGVYDCGVTVTMKHTGTSVERACNVHVTFFGPASEQNVALDDLHSFFSNGVVNAHVTLAYYPPGDPNHARNPRAFKSHGWDIEFPEAEIGNKAQKATARSEMNSLRQRFDKALDDCANALR